MKGVARREPSNPTTRCECRKRKKASAEACGRCLAIERELWRWIPMGAGRDVRKLQTESERARIVFEGRLLGVQKRTALNPGSGRGKPLEIKRAGGWPSYFEEPLPDGVQMTIVQSGNHQHPSLRRVGAI